MLPVVLGFPVATANARRPQGRQRGIRYHQVVIVAGETGSGKTIQLPTICRALGRGIEGLNGYTQPRRIAARSVAERIAVEDSLKADLKLLHAVRIAQNN